MTDIPALIERLRAHCYCGSSKWLTEDRPESDLCDVCLAATALAEQGKALAAARVAEGEAMLVVEQQDREIERLREERDNWKREFDDGLIDLRRAWGSAFADCERLSVQLAEAREVVEELANDLEPEINERYMAPDVHPAMRPKYERDMEIVTRARQWLASTEKQ